LRSGIWCRTWATRGWHRLIERRAFGGSEGVVARVVLVLGHLPVICEGCCVFPGEAPKTTLVNCSCHWVTSLAVGCCGALGELDFGLPISRRTTKWWSTQRERSVLASTWTSGEKLCVSIVIDSLDFFWWLVFILLWLVHPRRDGIKITYLSFTFHKLVVTSSLV
jgi:hypothetical protein